jgi:hypothetical protein
MYVVPEMVPLRARSFRTEVLQDDAGFWGDNRMVCAALRTSAGARAYISFMASAVMRLRTSQSSL